MASTNSTTFSLQSQLPHLPVPDLDKTLDKYLETVEPFLASADFQKTCAIVHEFRSNAGPVLQKRLLERQKRCLDLPPWQIVYSDSTTVSVGGAMSALELSPPVDRRSLALIEPTRDNWLIDWWNQYSYLRYRESVVLNVSFFFVFPLSYVSMITRAAQIAFYAQEFKDSFVSGQLKPDMMRDKALCMHQFKYLFNSCRVPGVGVDTVKVYDPVKHNHIVVIRRNNFYSVPLKKSDGTNLSLLDIENHFYWIVKDADSRGDAPNVGMLTAGHRDLWGKNYRLLKKDNAEFINVVQSSSFIICLDSATPITRNEIASLCWHGYGHNRWFDKSLQFIVFQNGRAGFLGEHSMMDATTPARLCDFICEMTASSPPLHKSDPFLASRENSTKSPLICKLDATLLKEIEITKKVLLKEINTRDLQTLNYQSYGKDLIKTFKCSPDSFTQLAIQLAYFRLMGTYCATYESAGMRGYQWGRTETCRSVNSETVEFCKAMENPRIPNAEKCALAREAVKSHSDYMQSCLQGEGIDRHFMGLRLCLNEDDVMPPIFLDPVYKLSCHWTLSTSQIPTNYFEGYGWGEVVGDGFGVAYMVRPDRVMFNVAGLVGDEVPGLDDHMIYDKIVDTAQVPTGGVPVKSNSATTRNIEQSYFGRHYKEMRVKWFATCLGEALDDLRAIFAGTEEPIVKSNAKRSKSRENPAIQALTSSVLPKSPSLKAFTSASNLGLSLPYPDRRGEDLDGVVGEDVGLIEFEVGWGEQRRNSNDETSSRYTRATKLVKMFAWPWGPNEAA